jgi:hypothetical protein
VTSCVAKTARMLPLHHITIICVHRYLNIFKTRHAFALLQHNYRLRHAAIPLTVAGKMIEEYRVGKQKDAC